MAWDDDILNALESLLVLVLQPRRWRGESPPTTGSLTMHIQPANHVAMICRKSGESHPRLSTSVDCGWEFDTTRYPYAPVRCLNPPAPAAVMNLVKCGWKSGYKRCRDNNRPCTDCVVVWISSAKIMLTQMIKLWETWMGMTELMMKLCIYRVFLS